MVDKSEDPAGTGRVEAPTMPVEDDDDDDEECMATNDASSDKLWSLLPSLDSSDVVSLLRLCTVSARDDDDSAASG